MSSDGPGASFNELIQAGRKRKQAEALANQILGSGRKTARNGASIDRKASASPLSLASRIGGVQKRSYAATTPKPNINGKWNHDLHDSVDSNTVAATAPRLPRNATGSSVDLNSRTYASLKRNVASLAVPNAQSSIRGGGAQMSIRGMAATGPFVVIASNFASGTTAADIEAAMAPVGGEITSCSLVATKPTVRAEIVFVDRDGAQNVIETFNNQKADGRLLHVYMKQGGPAPLHLSKPASTTMTVPVTLPVVMPIPTGPRLATQRGTLLRETAPVDPPPYEDHNVMEVDEEAASNEHPPNDEIVETEAHDFPDRINDARYMREDHGRLERDDRRYDGRNARGGRADYQDGRYGFGEQHDRRDFPRGGPRGGPREVPRDAPRDGPRNDPRDGPRNGPTNGSGRDYGRGGRDQRGLHSDGMYQRNGGYHRR